MKNYGIAFLFTLFTWGACAQTNEDTPWIAYKKAPLIDATSARKVNRFKHTPAALITYFYASRIRQDKRWKKVLPKKKQWSRKLKYAIKEYSNWVFTKFKLVSKKEYSSGKMWVKIWIEIEYKGRKDSGTDEVALELKNGKWVIVGLPT